MLDAVLAVASSTGLPLFSLAPRAARAQQLAPVEGKHFKRIEPPQPVANEEKIELLEFFSYACPACYALEPTLNAWVPRLAVDVRFRRVPVAFLPNAANFQRAYFALESLGLLEPLHGQIFRAVHVERQRLDKPEDIAALVTRSAGDAAKFLSAFGSFSVATSVTRAKKLAQDCGIESIPSLVVQGSFLTSPSQAGGGHQATVVVDALIQRLPMLAPSRRK